MTDSSWPHEEAAGNGRRYDGPPATRPGYTESSPPGHRTDGWTRLHIELEAALFTAEIQDITKPRE